jgi:hypothetical protein
MGAAIIKITIYVSLISRTVGPQLEPHRSSGWVAGFGPSIRELHS